MSDPDADDRLVTRDTLLLALVLLVGVAGTGVARRQLGLLGYDELGRIVFVLGYGGMVFVVWYGWIRPLDITGPNGNAGRGANGRGSDANAGGSDTGADGGDGDDPGAADDGTGDARTAATGSDRDRRAER